LEGKVKSGNGAEAKKKTEWKSKQRSAIEPEWLLKRRGAYCPLFFDLQWGIEHQYWNFKWLL